MAVKPSDLKPDDASAIVNGFGGRRVLVLGDMVADAYIVGLPARISREAPVLVLHHREEFICAGGAANVAHNLAALGAKVSVCGVIGEDSWGRALGNALSEMGIDTTGLIVDSERATATKTRIVARGEQQEIQQQVVRIDRVDRSRVDGVMERRLAEHVIAALAECEGLIVSDYENGLIGPDLIAAVLPEAKERRVVTTVDSHGDLLRFRGVTIATPNQPEAEATLKRELFTVQEVERGGEELRSGMDASAVLITRGNQGMSLFQRNEAPCHLGPTNPREVLDPTGAGDTTSAVVTLALIAGASILDAAALANVAAGEVIKKLGNAAVSAPELISAAGG